MKETPPSAYRLPRRAAKKKEEEPSQRQRSLLAPMHRRNSGGGRRWLQEVPQDESSSSWKDRRYTSSCLGMLGVKDTLSSSYQSALPTRLAYAKHHHVKHRLLYFLRLLPSDI